MAARTARSRPRCRPGCRSPGAAAAGRPARDVVCARCSLTRARPAAGRVNRRTSCTSRGPAPPFGRCQLPAASRPDQREQACSISCFWRAFWLRIVARKRARWPPPWVFVQQLGRTLDRGDRAFQFVARRASPPRHTPCRCRDARASRPWCATKLLAAPSRCSLSAGTRRQRRAGGRARAGAQVSTRDA